MDLLYTSKKRGGLGLIDIMDQRLALQNIYLHRAVECVNNNPITNVLNLLIRIYTRQPQVIPFLLAPQRYKQDLKHIPQLKILTELLLRLPPIPPHEDWFPGFIKHIPVQYGLLMSTESTVQSKSIPKKLTIKDMFDLPNYAPLFIPRDDLAKNSIVTKLHHDLDLGKTRWHQILDELLNKTHEPSKDRILLHETIQHWRIPAAKATDPPITVYLASPRT